MLVVKSVSWLNNDVLNCFPLTSFMFGQYLARANVGVWSYCDMMNICRREDGFSIDSESSRVLLLLKQ